MIQGFVSSLCLGSRKMYRLIMRRRSRPVVVNHCSASSYNPTESSLLNVTLDVKTDLNADEEFQCLCTEESCLISFPFLSLVLIYLRTTDVSADRTEAMM